MCLLGHLFEHSEVGCCGAHKISYLYIYSDKWENICIISDAIWAVLHLYFYVYELSYCISTKLPPIHLFNIFARCVCVGVCASELVCESCCNALLIFTWRKQFAQEMPHGMGISTTKLANSGPASFNGICGSVLCCTWARKKTKKCQRYERKIYDPGFLKRRHREKWMRAKATSTCENMKMLHARTWTAVAAFIFHISLAWRRRINWKEQTFSG